MLIPFDLVAALLLLGLAAADPAAPQPLPRSALLAFLPVLASLLLNTALFAALSRFLRGHAEARRLAHSAEGIVRALSVAWYFSLLELSAWPVSAAAALGFAGDEDRSLLARNLLGILPFLGLSLAGWIPLWQLRRAFGAGWTFRAWLLHRARTQWFVLALWLPSLLLFHGLLPLLPATPGAEGMPALIVLIGLAWVFPAVLRRLWGCRPVTDPALLALVRGLEAKTGRRVYGVYEWDLGGGSMMNAAAVGLAPPFLYLFFSRALLARLRPEEIEAVAAHELGHVRHRHLLFYFFLTLAALTLIEQSVYALRLGTTGTFLLLASGMAVYLRFVFAWFSRRLEAQADLAALELTGSASPLCNALERIALASGHSRLAPSWHHRSIAERVSFLRAAEARPELARLHHAGLRQSLLASLLLALCVAPLALSSPADAPAPALVPLDGNLARHWERLARHLPDDPAGPLGLARLRLAAGDHEAAADFAEEALRRTPDPDTAAEIENILRSCAENSPPVE